MARVLIPLPAQDFDPSEAAISWQVLSKAGHIVNFATPDGRPAVADDMMLTGQGLDFWGQIPHLRHLRLIGLLMRANRAGRDAYAAMTADRNYFVPRRWDEIDPAAFDGLLLPGGHRARHARLSRERDASGLRHKFLRGEKAGRGDLPRCVARGTQHFQKDRSLGAVRIPDYGADLGARKQRVESRPLHAVLGSKLLSNLSGTDWRAGRLHVGAAGSDALARAPRGFSGRARDRP